MKPQDFEFIRQLLKERSGLALTLDKVYLVESRLMPLARRNGLASIDDLVGLLRAKRDDKLYVEVTDAMMTNESFFFRDITPFDTLRKNVLPQIVEARTAAKQNKIRIWSAACSSGQEPYTIAMILKEEPAKFAGLKADILATDLSTEIIAKARAGTYTQFEVQRGLAVQYLVKYFKQIGDHWQIDEAIRGAVDFRNFNLLQDFAGFGRFDVIFCRNVLIYFDQATKADILTRMSRILAPDGVLFLGGAESVLGVTEAFKPISGLRGVYAVNAAGAAQQPIKTQRAG